MRLNLSNMNTAPTLDDVARVARVSTATVSRCLNMPERVTDKTRARVLSAVEALGYTPNFAARVMAARRTFTIGAIIPTMENAIFARGLQAFQEELHARGYTLLVASSAYQPELEQEQIKALVARGADGLLLIGHDRDPAIYEYLARQRVPALAAWSFVDDGAIPSIGFSNRDAMFELAQDVLQSGHREIAMISGVIRGNDRARARLEGVRAAMTDHGLDPAQLTLIETPYEIENGADAFATLMDRQPRPTVVLCGNDVLAAGALRQAHHLGLRVPQDVSITGFDDLELARLVSPALATVHVPHREMGREAARMLVDMVEGKTPGTSVRLGTTLHRRASLGAVPGDMPH